MAFFVPRPYQHLIRRFMFDNERGNIFASMGTGKTGSSICSFDELRMFGEAKRGLVLAPKRVAESSWPDEITKWRESFGHLKIVAAIGTADQRLAALRANADLTCINYDNAEWLLEQYGVDNWPFDVVFADESTRLKRLRVSLQTSTRGKEFIRGQGSSRAKALARVAHTKVRRWYNLTGSPAPNGLIDLWGQQWFIDAGKRLGTSFDAYAWRYFRQSRGAERGQERYEVMPYQDAAIHAKVAETSITIDAKDWFDIEQPIVRHVEIVLPPKARQQYEEMRKKLFTWIEDHPLEAFSAGVKSLKLLQLASGSVYYDKEENWAKVHDEKIDALQSIVEETNGEPLLVRYAFRPDKERICKAFPRARTLDKDSKGTIAAFQRGEIPMLVLHAASAGHGLDLQHHCRVLVDYSTDYNLEHDEQIIERIGPTRQAQIGKKVAVFRYRIIAKDTIEQTVVLPVLSGKMTVQEALKDAVKKAR